MKALIQLGCLLFLSTLFFSCEPEYTYLAKEVEGEFIEAEIDGQIFRFTRHYPVNSYSFRTFLAVDSFLILDQLFIGAISEDGTQSMSMRGMNLRLLETDFPFFVPDTLSNNESPGVTFTYDKDISLTPFFTSENSETGSVNVTIEKWDQEDYVEGMFDGTILDEMGNNKELRNGNFRIKVIRQ